MSPITRIETFRVPPRWLFVRVETADGAVGWGEASLEGHAEAVEGAFAALRDRLVGSDGERIEDVWQTAYRLGFYRGGPVLMSALSGLDQALWDLQGKRLGVPVWQLLGGRVRAATPDGSVDLSIPAGTTGAKPLRLRGRGLPVKGGGRGDLYITPRIVLPEGGDAELTGFLTARRNR